MRFFSITTITLQVICDWPTLTIKLSVHGRWSESPMEQNKIIAQPPQRDVWLNVHAGQVIIFNLSTNYRLL